MSTSEYLSVGEASEQLGISITTLRKLTDRNVIECERTPGGHRRIHISEIARFMRGRQNKLALYTEMFVEQHIIDNVLTIAESQDIVIVTHAEERESELTRPLPERRTFRQISQMASTGQVNGILLLDPDIIGHYAMWPWLNILHDLGFYTWFLDTEADEIRQLSTSSQ